MTRLESLRAKRGNLVDQMEAILAAAETDERELTDEEHKKLGELKADDDRVARAIEAEEMVLQRKAALAQPVNAPPAVRTIAAVPQRHGKLKSFRGAQAEENAYRSGMWVMAALFENGEAREWCRENGISITKAAAEGINSLGGFLVPTEFETAIIDLREEFGLARRLMRQHAMSSDHVVIPRREGGLTAYAVGENDEITDSDAAWGQVSLTARKWAVLTRISSEISADAIISMVDRMAGEIAYAFAVKEDDCAFNGDGTSTYHSIVGLRPALLQAGHAGSVYTPASGLDTFAELTLTDFHSVVAKLPLYAQNGARWTISQPGWAMSMQRLQAAAGGNDMRTLADGSLQLVFLGYPVDICQSYPTALTDISDVVMLTFGRMDLAGTMGTRQGIMLATTSDRYFEYDQSAIRGTERFDINWHDLGTATAAGPIIGLVGE